jgi:hypothetical protein
VCREDERRGRRLDKNGYDRQRGRLERLERLPSRY